MFSFQHVGGAITVAYTLRLTSMSLFLADLIIIKFVLAILIDNLLSNGPAKKQAEKQ